VSERQRSALSRSGVPRTDTLRPWAPSKHWVPRRRLKTAPPGVGLVLSSRVPRHPLRLAMQGELQATGAPSTPAPASRITTSIGSAQPMRWSNSSAWAGTWGAGVDRWPHRRHSRGSPGPRRQRPTHFVWKYQGWLVGFNGGPLRQPQRHIKPVGCLYLIGHGFRRRPRTGG
jgi:hypothetical protein